MCLCASVCCRYHYDHVLLHVVLLIMTESNVRFVGIGGSNRPGSSSARVMNLVLEFLASRGHKTSSLLLSDLKLPGFESCDKLEDYPPNVHHFLSEVRLAHGLIFSTPVYHGTLSGGMKNALDFLEYLADDPQPYLTGKVIGLISTSGGQPGVNAINTMDYVSRALHAWVCPTAVAIPQSNRQFEPDGRLKDPGLLARLHQMALELEFAVTRFQL